MTYDVTCSKCDLDREIEELESVLELQETHRRERGAHHIIEFELMG